MSFKKISTALILAGSTMGHAALAAQPIVGSWYFAYPPTAYAVVTFLEDGTFFLATDHPDGSDPNGFEWGAYVWDSTTGKLDTPSFLVDTNGESGFSSPFGGQAYLTISNNSIQLTDDFDSTSGSRILPGSSSIVGTWVLPGAPLMVSFLGDGTYFMAEGGDADDDGQPGIERGTYSWDVDTGKLMATQIFTDTNGGWGASDLALGYFVATLTANGGLAIQKAGAATLYLQAAPVPEPETWTMLLAGLGLVGFAARRRKCLDTAGYAINRVE
jgi:hypothetical protein